MELQNEDKKKIKELMEEKWKSKGCNICENNHMSIIGNIYELREYEGGMLSTSSNMIHVVPIICEECGNTILIKVDLKSE